MTNEKAVEAMVEAIFTDLRDRRFLKWLFDARGDKCLIGNLEGEPLTSLDLEVQAEIKKAWSGILSTALPEIRREAFEEAAKLAEGPASGWGEHVGGTPDRDRIASAIRALKEQSI